MKDLAVDERVGPAPVYQHALHVLRIREILTLYEHVLAIRFRILFRITFLGVHDDYPVHAPGNMLLHGRGTAVIHENAGVIRAEREVLGLARIDRCKLLGHVYYRSMKIHGVRVLVGGGIDQLEVDDVTFLNAHYRAGNRPAERPGRVFRPFVVDLHFGFHRLHGDLHGLGADGLGHGR